MDYFVSRIIQKIEENAKKYSEKTALAFKETEYSFSELYKTAKRLSSSIDSSYIQKPIIVFANREAETILFFLAVLLSGNYYIPIDPEMPKEKLRVIFSETQPKYVFGNERNIHAIEGIVSNETSFLDMHSRGENAHVCPITPDCPLYMVYTSGSTGKPKGVLKTHGAMTSFMETFPSVFRINSKEVIGNQTPFFFDASAKDIYLMIETGSRLEIIPSELFVIPPRLISYLNEKKISYISWVPTALSLTAQMNAFHYVIPRFLKNVFFVGEVMPVKTLNYWVKHLPEVRFVNLYGQSEIAGVACYYEIHEQQAEGTMLPIGKALPNCRVFLMNEQEVPNKPEAVGEIVISSRALAIGYYNDLERTKKAFGLLEGKRVFRTGDYAYYNKNNDLVFTARKDSQIKHLGRRIELGEIEAVAGSIDGLQRCCCLYDDTKKRIVLFCQMDSRTDANVDTIKAFLSGKLSSYMMPGKIVVGPLPINANGKIDRQLLKQQM